MEGILRDNWIEFFSLIQEDTEESSCPTSHRLLLQSWTCPPLWFCLSSPHHSDFQLEQTNQHSRKKKRGIYDCSLLWLRRLKTELNFIWLSPPICTLALKLSHSNFAKNVHLFIYVSARASHCGGFSCRAQVLGCTSFVGAVPTVWSTGSVVVVHRLSCSLACGIFPEQGSNPYLLHRQADSLPLSHQGGGPLTPTFRRWVKK